MSGTAEEPPFGDGGEGRARDVGRRSKASFSTPSLRGRPRTHTSGRLRLRKPTGRVLRSRKRHSQQVVGQLLNDERRTSTGFAARGLTLIEVVAALALMATLLVATLTIKAGLSRRRAAADRQLRAVAAADGLLTDWWRDPATFPVGRSGAVRSDPTLAWSTRPVPNAAADRLGARTVRVDVRDATAVVVSVDVLLPPEGRP